MLPGRRPRASSAGGDPSQRHQFPPGERRSPDPSAADASILRPRAGRRAALYPDPQGVVVGGRLVDGSTTAGPVEPPPWSGCGGTRSRRRNSALRCQRRLGPGSARRWTRRRRYTAGRAVRPPQRCQSSPTRCADGEQRHGHGATAGSAPISGPSSPTRNRQRRRAAGSATRRGRRHAGQAGTGNPVHQGGALTPVEGSRHDGVERSSRPEPGTSVVPTSPCRTGASGGPDRRRSVVVETG